jgi:hypothetical protein
MAEAAVALGGGDGLGHRYGIVLRDAVADQDAGDDVGQFANADGLRHPDILGVPPLRATRVTIGRPRADMAKIAIIGGGVIGSSIAYYLALAGHAADVVVVEPDPTYEFAATSRATGGIRQLFTVPENIRMAQYGHEIYGQFETLMAVDGDLAPIDFRRRGYLWLGSGENDIDALMANWRVQTAHDARVELLDRKGVKHRFPSSGSKTSTSPPIRRMTVSWIRTAC